MWCHHTLAIEVANQIILPQSIDFPDIGCTNTSLTWKNGLTALQHQILKYYHYLGFDKDKLCNKILNSW